MGQEWIEMDLGVARQIQTIWTQFEYGTQFYQYLIEKGVKFNSENFFPEGITKDEKSNFENYPAIKKVANMKGYDDVKVKDELTKVWEKVNG